MPIYEYECESCGHLFDVLQKVSDPLLQKCPSCGQSSLKKLVSAASFRLSGSGWYETDFKSDNKRNLATNESQKKSESKESSKDAKKKDKKNGGKKAAADKKSTASSSKKDVKSS